MARGMLFASPRVSHDVIIVGGGFTGTTLAAALSDGRRRILVLEARSGPRKRFAGELLHPTGVDVLRGLGLAGPLLDAGAVRIDGFAVYPSADEAATLLPYRGAPGVSSPGLAMDHDKMVGVLRTEVARRPGVELRYGERAASLLREAGRVVGVITERGEVLRASLVLSAEGRYSRLRGELGVPVESRLLSYTAVVHARATLAHPHHGQIFLGAAGPILAYTIAPDEIRLCFDLPERKHPRELAEYLDAHYLPQLPAPFVAAVRHALQAETPQLVATHAMRAERTVHEGMVLVGDAGACAHPLTAGGMTLCLNDVRLLAKNLKWRSHDAALATYETERLEMLLARSTLTDALYDIFSRDDRGASAMRSGVFRYWRDPRARAASVALLAGADLSRLHLMAEYARVLGCAMLSAPTASRQILETALRHGHWGLRSARAALRRGSLGALSTAKARAKSRPVKIP